MIDAPDLFRAFQPHRGEAIVTTAGTSGHHWTDVSTRQERDVMLGGAMGGTAPAALGLALGLPDEKVVLFDAEGSLLMNLGVLATIAGKKPGNFYHFLLDNECYATTGGQPVPNSEEIDYATVARGAGYASAHHFDDLEEFTTSVGDIMKEQGPVFVSIKVVPEVENLPIGLRERRPSRGRQQTIDDLQEGAGDRHGDRLGGRVPHMRILHFADVHIGVENYGRTDPETGLSTRLTDFLATFDEVVSYALDTRVDLVLFCGDAYKSRDPSQTHQREFARRVARIASAGVPVFLLIGNHDTPHVSGRATAVEIFRTLDVSRVVIGDTPRTYRIETPGGPVQIVAVPWIKRSDFLANDETRGLSPDQINEAVQERLTRIVRRLADDLEPAVPAVLAGHVTVSQATTSSEQSMMLGRDHVLLNSAVALPELEYVALGHIHKHQVLSHDPLAVYSGSLQRVDFGEERDEKGFCVVELDTSKMQGARQVGFEFRQGRSEAVRDGRRAGQGRGPVPHRHGGERDIGGRHRGRRRQGQRIRSRGARRPSERVGDS